VRLTPSAASIATAVLLGIGATLLAAWLPAARAVRLGIAMTLSGRGREGVPADGRRRWTSTAVLGAAAIVAIVLQAALASPVVGLVATALVAATVAAAAPPLVQTIAKVAEPWLRRHGDPSGRLAATGLRDHPRRVGLTTATIAVGIAAVGWLWILARSFEGSVVDALGRAIRADLVVTSTNIGSGFLEAPLGGEVVDAVRAVPGVRAAAGWRALEWPYRGDVVGLSAYDAIYFRDRRFGEWPMHAASVSDPWEAVARGEGVVVSTSFVKSFGLGAGETLELDTPTGPATLPIVGVTTDFVSPKGTIEIARELFERRWRDGTVTRTFLLKTDDVTAADLRARLASALGPTFGIRILSARELMDYFVTQVRRAFSVIPIFAGTVYLVILVGLASSLATSVLDRRRELAVVRAVGLRPSLVRRVVVLESLVIGVVGLGLATAGALVLATLWVTQTFQLLLGWALQVEIPVPELLAVGLVTLGVCYLASRAPARRAEAIEVAEALRYD